MLHARPDYQDRIQDSAKLIPEAEPIFFLRAQDRTGAATVRFWVREQKKLLAADRKANGGNPVENEAGRKKAIALAEAHAFRMDDWPKKKAADA